MYEKHEMNITLFDKVDVYTIIITSEDHEGTYSWEPDRSDS